MYRHSVGSSFECDTFIEKDPGEETVSVIAPWKYVPISSSFSKYPDLSGRRRPKKRRGKFPKLCNVDREADIDRTQSCTTKSHETTALQDIEGKQRDKEKL